MTADVLYFHISDGSQLVIGQMAKISCMSAVIQVTSYYRYLLF